MTPKTLGTSTHMFKLLRKTISIVVLVTFIATSVKSPAYAQAISGSAMPWMPKPGVMISMSPPFNPANLKGMIIHPENSLQFDFIINRGDDPLTDEQKKTEYNKLIKYFLASLATPDDDQWVNLSPYEKDRIIKDDFAKTEMGRDVLAEDYILKQITSSLIYPESKLGQKFWDKVYTEAQQQFGTTNVPLNTFNKVWIVPDEAVVYEKGNIVYLQKSHLKVMMEEDYLSLTKHTGITNTTDANKTHALGSKIVKEIVIPELEREVNEGKNFAPLRQVFSGVILAVWYKQALKESLLGKIYADKSKVKGVDQDPQTNEIIYKNYLKAFKKGVFNYIKEDVDKYTNETIPRKYFSGGWQASTLDDPKILQRKKGDAPDLTDGTAAMKTDVAVAILNAAQSAAQAQPTSAAMAIIDGSKSITSRQPAIDTFVASVNRMFNDSPIWKNLESRTLGLMLNIDAEPASEFNARKTNALHVLKMQFNPTVLESGAVEFDVPTVDTDKGIITVRATVKNLGQTVTKAGGKIIVKPASAAMTTLGDVRDSLLNKTFTAPSDDQAATAFEETLREALTKANVQGQQVYALAASLQAMLKFDTTETPNTYRISASAESAVEALNVKIREANSKLTDVIEATWSSASEANRRADDARRVLRSHKLERIKLIEGMQPNIWNTNERLAPPKSSFKYNLVDGKASVLELKARLDQLPQLIKEQEDNGRGVKDRRSDVLDRGQTDALRTMYEREARALQDERGRIIDLLDELAVRVHSAAPQAQPATAAMKTVLENVFGESDANRIQAFSPEKLSRFDPQNKEAAAEMFEIEQLLGNKTNVDAKTRQTLINMSSALNMIRMGNDVATQRGSYDRNLKTLLVETNAARKGFTENLGKYLFRASLVGAIAVILSLATGYIGKRADRRAQAEQIIKNAFPGDSQTDRDSKVKLTDYMLGTPTGPTLGDGPGSYYRWEGLYTAEMNLFAEALSTGNIAPLSAVMTDKDWALILSSPKALNSYANMIVNKSPTIKQLKDWRETGTNGFKLAAHILDNISPENMEIITNVEALSARVLSGELRFEQFEKTVEGIPGINDALNTRYARDLVGHRLLEAFSYDQLSNRGVTGDQLSRQLRIVRNFTALNSVDGVTDYFGYVVPGFVKTPADIFDWARSDFDKAFPASGFSNAMSSKEANEVAKLKAEAAQSAAQAQQPASAAMNKVEAARTLARDFLNSLNITHNAPFQQTLRNNEFGAFNSLVGANRVDNRLRNTTTPLDVAGMNGKVRDDPSVSIFRSALPSRTSIDKDNEEKLIGLIRDFFTRTKLKKEAEQSSIEEVRAQLQIIKTGRTYNYTDTRSDGTSEIDLKFLGDILTVQVKPSAAMSEAAPVTQAASPAQKLADNVGGIDLNAANLNLQIKRDGKGVPLPFSQQDIGQLNRIEGLIPVIMEIKPASAVPMLSQAATSTQSA